ELGLPAKGFDVILANPPFSGRLDKDRIVEEVKIGRTAQTELLFLQYMINQLKEGGRCGVVVPEGVLFGSTGAHRELRRKLVENNTVEAVLSLPGGVFNPYSGVKTSVLVFSKGGTTKQVMFLHADNDGFKLDSNHDQPVEEDDLPTLIEAFQDRDARFDDWCRHDTDSDWTEKWWFADANAIREADYNLSANRHRPRGRAKVEHRDPLEILAELRTIETEILGEIDGLAEAVREAMEELTGL
ncbi:MAG: N-6 DNA methylase, partial [Acidimicrobiia bacterium]|nr:N-6 DNA methylase [Acidimicrobiia bacterium]